MGLHDTCVSRSGVGGSWSTDTLMAMIIYTILNIYIYIALDFGSWYHSLKTNKMKNGKRGSVEERDQKDWRGAAARRAR